MSFISPEYGKFDYDVGDIVYHNQRNAWCLVLDIADIVRNNEVVSKTPVCKFLYNPGTVKTMPVHLFPGEVKDIPNGYVISGKEVPRKPSIESFSSYFGKLKSAPAGSVFSIKVLSKEPNEVTSSESQSLTL